MTAADCWMLVWQLAGIVGVDPMPLTLRELVWMADARRRDAWERTASLLSMLWNTHAEQPRSPAHFFPFDQPGRRQSDKLPAPISALKVFLRE